jgi:uncharacterized protein YecT (DUF1311 family)
MKLKDRRSFLSFFLSCLVLLSALSSIFVYTHHAYGIEPIANCSFCDTWKPYNSEGVSFSSKDLFIVTRDSLALPGCSSVKAIIVKQGFDKDYLDDADRPLPIFIIYKLVEQPKCKKIIPDVYPGALVELYVNQPQFDVGSERMDLAIVSSTEHRYGERIPAKVRWELIRKQYNPGDEGSGYGTGIALSIEQREVDEQLNKEWQLLLAVVNDKQKSDIKKKQRKWLKFVNKVCSKDEGAAPQWENAYFSMCLTDAFKKRIKEFKDLRKCITAKKTSCPSLTISDPSINNMDYR